MFDAHTQIKPKVTISGGTGDEHERKEQPIGRLLQNLKGLSDAQLEEIFAYQRDHQVRFGEAAVALHFASNDDIMGLLSRQFHYPYEPQSDVDAYPPELVAAAHPFSEGAELFRDLRTQLLMGPMNPELPRTALAVVSAEEGDGKSFCASNLAVTFSQSGGRTLLLDANMRRPAIARIFDIPKDALGLSAILAGRAVESVIHPVKGLPSLFVLPSGALPPNPQELLQRVSFTQLMVDLVSSFDHVIIDTPASGTSADFRMITARAGTVLAVARKDKTSVSNLDGLLHALQMGKSTMAGVVLNNY